MKFFQHKNLRRILYVIVAAVLLCCTLAGSLIANAWNTTGSYRLMQFNSNSAETVPALWRGGDVRGFADGNFDTSGGPDNNGVFRAIFNNSQDTSNPIDDPYIAMYTGATMGLDYKVNAGDIVQVVFRFEDVTFKSGSENVTCSKMYFAGAGIYKDSNGNVAYNETYTTLLSKPDWTHENYQVVTGVVPQNIVGKELDFIRFDPLDGKTFSLDADGKKGWYLDYIYVGDLANAPYKKVTFNGRNSTNGTTTTVQWIKKGSTISTVPSTVTTAKTSSTATTQYVWKNTWSGKSVSDVKAITINAPTTFTADYKTQYKVIYKQLRSAYNGSFIADAEEWVDSGKKPTKADDYPNYLYNVGSTARQKINTWKISTSETYYTPAQVNNLTVSSPLVFYAAWQTEWQVRFLGVDASGNYTNVLSSNYIVSMQKISSKWPTLPTVNVVYNKTNANDSSHRYAQTAVDNKWLIYSDAEGKEFGFTSSTILDSVIGQPKDIKARYDTQYPVRYLDANKSVIETDWVISDKKTTAFNGTLPTKQDSAFVGWVKATNTTTPAATVNAENPGSTAITAQTYYHPRFLSNSFVGSNSNNLVITRKVTLQPGTTNAEHKYRLRIDFYHYGGVVTNGANNTVAGEMAGYLKLFDNIKMDFFKNIKGPKVFALRYLGNGKFEDDTALATKMANDAAGKTGWDARLSAGGSFGYVFEMVEHGKNANGEIEYTEWQSKNHATSNEPDHRFFTMHLFDGSKYTNINGSNADDLKSNFYCREVSSSNQTVPRGFKYVIVVDFELDRDGTIGGNNVPLSHKTQNSMLQYFSSLTATSAAKTINLSDVSKTEYKNSSNQTVTSTTWPNANIEILYDFCPNDYYMDLYDVKKTHIIRNGEMTAEREFVQPGLITVLRRQATGKNEDNAENNYIIYGGMYTHGNGPVYARTAADVKNNYNMTGLPNTDCNGVRNEKVTITYSVKHNGLNKVVYETMCKAYEHEFHAVKADGSDGKHGEIKVDFLQDHSVTITATVKPLSNDADTFGRSAIATTWTRSAQSYYFAPRITVMDTSNNISIPLQNEAKSTDSMVKVNNAEQNFKVVRSVIYADKKGIGSVSAERLSNIVKPGLKSGANIFWTFYKDGATKGYQYGMNSLDAKTINGIQVIDYKVQAINAPKRYTSTDTVANCKTILRHAYYIPSTCITYDQNALTFDISANWTKTGIVSQEFQQYHYSRGPAGTDRYGYDKYWITGTRVKDKDENGNDIENGQVGNFMDYNGGSLYTNVDATERNEWGIFTFTGTGFDLYSRNGPDMGIIVAQVYEGTYTAAQLANKTPLQNIFADTYLDTATYYQVPSIQWRAEDASGNLKHGTYTVRFRAYYHEAFDHQLYKNSGKKATMTEAKVLDIMGWDNSVPCRINLSDAAYPALTRATKTGDYNVYIDGIRVYNTLGVNLTQATGNVLSNTTGKEKFAAYAIYNRDKEVNAKYFNVNETLVDAENQPAWNGGEANGVFYIAANGGSTTNSAGQYVGYYIGMEGDVYTEAFNYTDSAGNKYIKYYFLDANGNRIADKKTGKYIFRYSKDNKHYIETTPWTVLSGHELNLALANRIAFYGDKYDAIGPEFEIYLSKGNGVAFNVSKTGAAVTAVHVSLRCSNTPMSNQIPVDAEVYDASTKQWVDIPITYKADFHEQYYDVTKYANANNGNVYIRNNGANSYLSVMNVKVVGGTPPTANTRMMVEAIELIRGEAETPVVDEGLSLKHSLNLESDISINYVVPATAVDGAQNSYLCVEVPRYRGNELVGTETVTVNGTPKGGLYYYTLTGLTAVQMNDELKASLHVIKNGEHFVSAEDHYSIASYAYTQLNKETTSESLKALCANLLRYGGAAQIFKGYRTDFLADEELSVDHRAFLTDLETVSFGTTNAVLEDLEAPAVLWKGKALDLNSKVAIKFVVDPANYEGEAENLSLRVTYLNGNGEEETVTLTESELYAEGDPARAFVFDGLLAAELRTVLSVAVYDGETRVSATLQYAADAYGNGKTGALGTLCKALFAYADAAEAFFVN